MGLYTKKQKSDVQLHAATSVESGGSLDIESGATFKVAGTTVSATAAELNRNDFGYQLLVADGAITVKNGICKIAKTVAGAVAATLADPTDVDDDFKRLLIISNQAQANTVTSASSFGGGGGGEDVATFSGAIGDSLELVAHGGKWYVAGSHQCTIA
jgi:hypothetical protein